MRILHALAWVLVALACAAPNCDTHDAPLGSGSGSSAWARMPPTSGTAQAAPVAAGSDAEHHDVVHAMESVTGASLESAKPKKPTSSTKHASSGGSTSGGGGGNYGGSSPPKPAEPPPPPLPESGRKLGQPCDDREQCASNLCEFDVCAKHYDDKLTTGEKCDYDNQCVSDHCYHDVCE
jgi:hypothetical protein